MLAVAAAYAAVVVARWLSRLLQVGPVLDRPQVLEIMYLHERRVDESLALLGQWLADEETVTEEATIQGGVVVGAKGFLARLSHNRRRRIARAIRKRPLGNAEERYQRLHDYLRIDAISDDSPTTLQEKTFREFRLVGVLPASDLNADQLYAVGQLQDLGLRVWFRIDKEWRREPFQEFRGELTVVARAVTEPMPDELIGLLPQRNNPPEWRLRPLAIFR